MPEPAVDDPGALDALRIARAPTIGTLAAVAAGRAAFFLLTFAAAFFTVALAASRTSPNAELRELGFIIPIVSGIAALVTMPVTVFEQLVARWEPASGRALLIMLGAVAVAVATLVIGSAEVIFGISMFQSGSLPKALREATSAALELALSPNVFVFTLIMLPLGPLTLARARRLTVRGQMLVGAGSGVLVVALASCLSEDVFLLFGLIIAFAGLGWVAAAESGDWLEGARRRRHARAAAAD